MRPLQQLLEDEHFLNHSDIIRQFLCDLGDPGVRFLFLATAITGAEMKISCPRRSMNEPFQ